MLYHYFGNKKELYEAVLKKNLVKIYTIHRDILSPPGNYLDQIKNSIREYFYFLAENPNFVRLMEWEFLQGAEYAVNLLLRYSIYGIPLVEDVLQKGIEDGTIRPDVDSRQLLLSINAMCFFYFNRIEALNSIWEDDMHSSRMLEQRLHHILQLVFRAILADPDTAEDMLEQQ